MLTHLPGQRMISYVFHHADHSTGKRLEASGNNMACFNLSSNCRLSRPHGSRKQLVNDQYKRRSMTILLVEIAPFDQPCAERFQVAWRDAAMKSKSAGGVGILSVPT